MQFGLHLGGSVDASLFSFWSGFLDVSKQCEAGVSFPQRVAKL